MYKFFQYFGISSLESKIYIALLDDGIKNGSELANILNLTRASVYGALRNLQKKGVVRHIPGQPQRYQATPKDQLLANFRKLSQENLEQLDRSLKDRPKSKKVTRLSNSE